MSKDRNLAPFHQKFADGIRIMGALAVKYFFVNETELRTFAEWLSQQTLGYLLTNSFQDIFDKFHKEAF